MNQLYKILLLILPLITNLHADTIYKIVDDQGNVTYTTTPPANKEEASTINVAPEPSEERVKAAQERQSQNIRTGDIIDENRAERNKITQEKNRIRKEKQEQQQQKESTKEYNDTQHFGYPYYPGRIPGRPVARPPVHRPAIPSR